MLVEQGKKYQTAVKMNTLHYFYDFKLKDKEIFLLSWTYNFMHYNLHYNAMLADIILKIIFTKVCIRDFHILPTQPLNKNSLSLSLS